MTDVVIIGAGGAGREAAWVFQEASRDANQWNVLGFLDDNPALQGASLCELPVLADLGWLVRNSSKQLQVFCAIGDPRKRKRVVDRVASLGFTFCSVVHPSVVVSSSTELAPGSLISAGAILTTDTTIGPHVMINVACTISHDSVIGA